MPDRSNDRERRTASGTAHVGKGEKVSTSGPLGSGPRPSGNKGGTGNNSAPVHLQTLTEPPAPMDITRPAEEGHAPEDLTSEVSFFWFWQLCCCFSF